MEISTKVEEILNKSYKHINEFFNDFDSLVSQYQPESSTINRLYVHNLSNTFEEIEEVSYLHSDLEIYLKRNDFNDIKIEFISELYLSHYALISKTGKKYKIKETSLPPSEFDEQSFSTLIELVLSLKEFMSSLEQYFDKLKTIDEYSWVVDPVKPTLKDGYRRVVIEDRIWLHIEISLKGDIHCLKLLGSGERFDQKRQLLQSKVCNWESGVDILDILEDLGAQQKPSTSSVQINCDDTRECGICMCDTSDDGVALPLCSNKFCNSYFHNGCLYQWYKQCNGGLITKSGLAKVDCPNCSQPIYNISEKC